MARRLDSFFSMATSAFLFLMVLYSAPVYAARIVYLAEQNFVGLKELFLVDLERPGQPTQLNPPLPQISNGRFSSGVLSFAVSPDGARVAFSADQENVGDMDLYLVDITAPGVLTRIGSLPAGHLELRSMFSPDGSKLVYTASDAHFADTQLYLVDLFDPGTSIRLNGDLAQYGAVSQAGFQFTPDGTHVVYTAGELEAKFELYAVDLSAPGQSVRLNASGGSVGDSSEGRFLILPDSRHVIYSAVWQNPDVRELHMVSLDQAGQPITLNAPLQPAGDVFDFDVSPDGRFVSYRADQDTDGKLEAFLVSMDKPGESTRVNGAAQSNAGLAQFTPDSQSVLYVADEERSIGDRDLYSAVIGTPITRARVNAPLADSFDIKSFVISPDGARVVYRPKSASEFATDLMLAKLDTPGSAIKLNGPLPDGTVEARPIKFSPDGQSLAFIAVESIEDSIQELFVSRLNNPGVSTRLNGPLPPGGLVSSTPGASFEFLPEDFFVVEAGTSSIWIDPERHGEGFMLEILADQRALVYWFTYDMAGQQDWYYSVGEIRGNRILFDDLLQVENGHFGPGFDPAEVENNVVGSASFSWSSCDTGVMDWILNQTGGYRVGHMNLRRLTNVMGLDCGQPQHAPSLPEGMLSGTWADPSRAAEGYSLEVLSNGSVLVYWFSYGTNSERRWFYNLGEIQGDKLVFENLLTTSGPIFGEKNPLSTLQQTPWGELELKLGCLSGTASYSSTEAGFPAGTQQLQRVTLLNNLVCP